MGGSFLWSRCLVIGTHLNFTRSWFGAAFVFEFKMMKGVGCLPHICTMKCHIAFVEREERFKL